MNSGQTAKTTLWAVVVIVLGVLATVVALAALAPADHLDNLVVQVLGIVAPCLAVLLAVRQVHQVDAKVERVSRATHSLTNGLLEAKVRTSVADVVQDRYLDPGMTEQLVADRVVSAQADRAAEAMMAPRLTDPPHHV